MGESPREQTRTRQPGRVRAGTPVTARRERMDAFHGSFAACHWHEELEFLAVTAGTMLCRTDGQLHRLETGSGMMFNAGIPHMCYPETGRGAEYLSVWIHPRLLAGGPDSALERQYLGPFTRAQGLAALPFRREGAGWRQKAWETCLAMEPLLAELGYGCELEAAGLATCLLAAILPEVREAMEHPGSALGPQRLKGLLNWLHSHYAETLNLTNMSEALGVSREGCCRLFRRELGMTISQYLAAYRVVQSVPMMLEGGCSVLEAADRVGFSNASRFAAAFRLQMGFTPKQYLNRVTATRR